MDTTARTSLPPIHIEIPPAWEDELVTSARAGDHDALAGLVRAGADRADAVALRMTGSPADAQDVVQDAMISAWQHLDGFTGQSSFATWLTRIVVDRCHDHHRTMRPQGLLEDVDEAHPGAHTGGEQDGGHSDTVIARARPAAVREAMLDLSLDQRAALVLCTVHGLTHPQSARTLGTSEADARVRVHGARATLVTCLEDRE